MAVASDELTEARLAEQLQSLSPSVRVNDARRVAEVAVVASRKLRREYGVVGPPLFHNFLVNTRFKKRGLCFQWTEDLMARLARVRAGSLQLHWADARATTWREHNCVVVTAEGQPFAEGIVLDAWRHGGRLFSGSVHADHYPWREVRPRCRPHCSSRSRAALLRTPAAR